MTYTNDYLKRGSGSNGSDKHDFSDVLKDMWHTRPVRIPSRQGSGAWIAGIAEGIAVRYQISPVLVRLGFVALSFFAGMGVLLYLLLLLVLPRYTVPLSPAEVVYKNRRDPRYGKERTVGWIVGLIVLLMIWPAGNALTSKDIIGVAVIALAAYLLHQRVPQPVADFYATAYEERPEGFDEGLDGSADSSGVRVGNETTTNSHLENPYGQKTAYSAADGFGQEPAGPTPPSWDPLGAAPFAWNLPDPDDEPAHAHAERPRRRKGIGRIIRNAVMTCVLLVGVGLVAALGFMASDLVNGNESSNVSAGTEGTFEVNVAPQNQKYEYWFANTTVDLGKLRPDRGVLHRDGYQNIEINGRAAEMILRIPNSTSGPSYRVQMECPNTIVAEAPCTNGSEFIVRGEDKGNRDPVEDEDLPTVNVTVNSAFSSMIVERT